MSNKPRFDAKACTTPVVTPSDAPSLSVIRQKALDDFRHAAINILALGSSLRADSSITRDAVSALVTLIIAERRLQGGYVHIDAADLLKKCDVPHELHPVLLAGIEGEMQRRLARQSEIPTKPDETAIRGEILDRVRQSFGSTN